jgi:hypothetical protein
MGDRQEQPGAARRTAEERQEQPTEASSGQEPAGAARSSQQQAGAARSRQMRPAAGRSSKDQAQKLRHLHILAAVQTGARSVEATTGISTEGLFLLPLSFCYLCQEQPGTLFKQRLAQASFRTTGGPCSSTLLVQATSWTTGLCNFLDLWWSLFKHPLGPSDILDHWGVPLQAPLGPSNFLHH